MTEVVLKAKDSQWWVYLIRNSSNALYCGITTDVVRRLQQHQQGKGAKALRGKGPLQLVWQYQIGTDRSKALQLEHRIKKLSKLEKERLIIDKDRLSDLYPEISS